MVPVSEGYDAEVRRAKKKGADTPAFAEERQRIADKYNSQLHEKDTNITCSQAHKLGTPPSQATTLKTLRVGWKSLWLRVVRLRHLKDGLTGYSKMN